MARALARASRGGTPNIAAMSRHGSSTMRPSTTTTLRP
jgi:hypothetical protein